MMVVLSLVLACRGACWILQSDNQHEAATVIDWVMCIGVLAYIAIHR